MQCGRVPRRHGAMGNLAKASARRDKLLGQWAAELMGLSGADAEAYAASVVVADLEEAGDEDVYRELIACFTSESASDLLLTAQCDCHDHFDPKKMGPLRSTSKSLTVPLSLTHYCSS